MDGIQFAALHNHGLTGHAETLMASNIETFSMNLRKASVMRMDMGHRSDLVDESVIEPSSRGCDAAFGGLGDIDQLATRGRRIEARKGNFRLRCGRCRGSTGLDRYLASPRSGWNGGW